MTEANVRRRVNGRSARVRRSVIESTLGLLREGGIDQVTVAEVASRAGVHETSIYRRWGSRERLLIDAILDLSEANLSVPDSGSLREDLTILATELCGYMSTPLGLAVAQLLSWPAKDPAVTEMQTEIWRDRIASAAKVVEQAIDRGEAPRNTDPRFIIELLIAPIHWRVLVLNEQLEPDLPAKLAQAVMDGVQPPR
ncbi:TetR/AcrR family transcriptional regulator [Streptomyces malaysiensis]|uniref:TetR/AcrR family transcriptional regulator n=1 Tax=Streptomyces malaysiensis TaxID=92644 RepID=UPI0015E1035D|nr:TetR/AcrR family transcriptional regulator [Streptomyces malaysiensis]